MNRYSETLNRFYNIVKEKSNDVMMGIIIDSPWMPGYMDVNTLDFYFDQTVWLNSYRQVLKDLPGVAFVPGSWVEYGMSAEPSGWGVKIEWKPGSPPSLHHFPGGLAAIIEQDTPDPEHHGMMPVILRQYERTREILNQDGIPPKMAAARGPLAVAAHLIGVTELLTATRLDKENCLALFEKTTDLCIKWLKAQLDRMDDPFGILVLDDIAGMMRPKMADQLAFPFLKRIFDSFPDMIHLFHNDTPNDKIFPGLAECGIDVFNFSHEISIERARELVGDDMVLFGNLPPVDTLVRATADQVKQATRELLKTAHDHGPIILSAGGGISPDTPIENLQAMADVVHSQ
ncbi:MAG: uroporphyrinogen decarboxylase family protein [candidate division KSB1 bacterium]|nr:uroporphyrinogen decarboxylase family protein [candidate division KSB1 bacterium]